MDYRLLATSQADQLADKAEWEVQHDRVTLHQWLLWLGQFCVPLAAGWVAVQLVSALLHTITPTFLFENPVEHLQYFFLVAALAYVAIVLLLTGKVVPFFVWIFEEVDFFITEISYRLIIIWREWDGRLDFWTLVREYTIEILFSRTRRNEEPVPEEETAQADDGHEEENDHEEEGHLQMEEQPRVHRRVLQIKTQGPWDGHGSSPRSPPIQSPPYDGNSPPPEPPANHSIDDSNQPGNAAHEYQPPFTPHTPLKMDHSSLSWFEQGFDKLPWILQVICMLIAVVCMAGLTIIHYMRWILTGVANPIHSPLLSGASSPWQRFGTLLSPRSNKPPSRPSSPPQPSASPPRPPGQRPERPGLRPVTTSSEQASPIQESPATLWPKIENRLLSYDERARLIWKTIWDWESTPTAMSTKFAEARVCLDKVNALQNKMLADHELHYATHIWGPLPMLQKIEKSIKRSYAALHGFLYNMDPGTKLNLTHGAPESEQDDQGQQGDPSRSKRVRFTAPRSLLRKQFDGQQLRQAFTHEKLKMKDVKMGDAPPTPKLDPIESARNRLHQLMRATTALIQAYEGLPYEYCFSLQSLQDIVDKKLPIPDLIFDTHGVVDRQERYAKRSRGEIFTNSAAVNECEDLFVKTSEFIKSELLRLSGESRTTTEQWQLKNQLDKAELLRQFLRAAEKALMQERLDEAKKSHWEVCSNTSKLDRFFLKAEPDRLYRDMLGLQNQIRHWQTLPHDPTEGFQEFLEKILEDVCYFIETLELDAKMRPFKPQRQVEAKPRVIDLLVRSLSQGLKPVQTSGVNYLCGPRALFTSLRAIDAIARGIEPEDILVQMFEKFHHLHTNKLPIELDLKSELTPIYKAFIDKKLADAGVEDTEQQLEEAKFMNNFSIHQIEWMLQFLVHQGYLEDKYQVGVVFEHCEGGPWKAYIPTGDPDDSTRETVWLYSNNAQILYERRHVWNVWAATARTKPDWWTPEVQAIDDIVSTSSGFTMSHWSGFGKSFTGLGKDQNWGLLSKVDSVALVENKRKKTENDKMQSIISWWKRVEAAWDPNKDDLPGREQGFDETLPRTPRTPTPAAAAGSGNGGSAPAGPAASSGNSDPDAEVNRPAGSNSAPPSPSQPPASPSSNAPPPNNPTGAKQKPVCKFFKKSGKCRDGANCQFLHATGQSKKGQKQSGKQNQGGKHEDGEEVGGEEQGTNEEQSGEANSGQGTSSEQNEDGEHTGEPNGEDKSRTEKQRPKKTEQDPKAGATADGRGKTNRKTAEGSAKASSKKGGQGPSKPATKAEKKIPGHGAPNTKKAGKQEKKTAAKSGKNLDGSAQNTHQKEQSNAAPAQQHNQQSSGKQEGSQRSAAAPKPQQKTPTKKHATAVSIEDDEEL